MKYGFLIALVLLLGACSEPEEKVIDISERTPKSKRNYDVPDTIPEIDSSSALLTKYQEWNSEIQSMRLIERKLFMERFRPDDTEKAVWYLSNGDSIEYSRIVFKDSVKTKTAFFNWLDHAEISYFGADERIQKDPMVILYGDTIIFTLSGAIDRKYWEDYIVDKEWIQQGDYWVTQRKYGKAEWYKFEDDQLQQLKEP